MQFFAQEQFVRMKLGTAPLARHYNKMKQVPDLTVNAENCGAMTTILVRRRDTSPVRITPQSVYNEAYSHELVPQQSKPTDAAMEWCFCIRTWEILRTTMGFVALTGWAV